MTIRMPVLPVLANYPDGATFAELSLCAPEDLHRLLAAGLIRATDERRPGLTRYWITDAGRAVLAAGGGRRVGGV
jgi:hypothetical protein